MAITAKEYIAALGVLASVVREDLHLHLPTTAEPVDENPEPEPEPEPEPVDASEPAMDGQEAVAPEEIEEPIDVYPVVGESRRIKIFGLSSNYIDRAAIGEAWQDENGQLHGTGLCRMMLFEPFANRMYIGSSAGLDTSPLAVFAFRLSISPFIRVEWESQDAE